MAPASALATWLRFSVQRTSLSDVESVDVTTVTSVVAEEISVVRFLRTRLLRPRRRTFRCSRAAAILPEVMASTKAASGRIAKPLSLV